MGRDNGEQPLLSKEGVGPAVVVPAPRPTLELVTVAQDAAKTHPGPLVEIGKGAPQAVLEVLQPAPLNRLEVRDDPLEAMPTCAPGLTSDLVLELLEALLARPLVTLLELV